MRQYISQEKMEKTLKELDARIGVDTKEHQAEIERIKRAKVNNPDTPLGFRTTPVRHTLWSDGSDTQTFRNTHKCWPISRSNDDV